MLRRSMRLFGITCANTSNNLHHGPRTVIGVTTYHVSPKNPKIRYMIVDVQTNREHHRPPGSGPSSRPGRVILQYPDSESTRSEACFIVSSPNVRVPRAAFRPVAHRGPNRQHADSPQ